MSSFGLLTRFRAASGYDLTRYIGLHFQVKAALLRVTVDSAALWFGFGALTGYGYNIVYFLAIILLQYALLVVAHGRP